ncbi:hypothetical protein SUGI_0662250 [Cryptomeria japonica]|uniref:BTB/POZ domain-containing protein At3g22104 n=1 Tax=Cryptomeria japonica TaxID=3369 RepID=UPI0024146C00|nr:BTB/POZ domain-containing protein At3g22104 [Cryptomeria japonica]GLJ32883.1 hypothetical protein SUGI_0662250 [Cryptomeria japonica]
MMHPHCDLEVNVNGEQTFLLDKKTLLSFCGRLIKLFNRAVPGQGQKPKSYKIVLHDLPGGPVAFELVARFCYKVEGAININPSNICKLRCAAEFLEMTEEIRERNLVELTQNYLKLLPLWTWREVFTVLKDCESMVPIADSTGIIQRCIYVLVGKINVKTNVVSFGASLSPVDSSSSSPESSTVRYSTASSCEATKTGWWFDDLGSLSIYLMERVVKSMIEEGVDNWVLSRFLFHYLRSSLPMLGYSSISPKKKCGREEKIMYQYTQKVQKEVFETVVGLLHRLHREAVSCRSLFGVLRVATVLNASKLCRKQLEDMIGAQLDQATLDNILIPAANQGNAGSLYDVDQVLRFVQVFVRDRHISPDIPGSSPSFEGVSTTDIPYGASCCQQSGVQKVKCLMDKYIAEVAPDINLKPSKFQALLEAFPDHARDCCDGLYRALDMYLEVHSTLSEEERTKLCNTINYQKLSFEASNLIAQNPRLPSRIAVQVLLYQQAKLRSMLDSHYTKGSVSSHFSDDGRMYIPQEEVVSDTDHAILYSKQVDYTSVICEENLGLKADLQGMQWRVKELEKICNKLHSQMSKLGKLKPKSSHGRLPRLCQ